MSLVMDNRLVTSASKSRRSSSTCGAGSNSFGGLDSASSGVTALETGHECWLGGTGDRCVSVVAGMHGDFFLW